MESQRPGHLGSEETEQVRFVQNRLDARAHLAAHEKGDPADGRFGFFGPFHLFISGVGVVCMFLALPRDG